ncbi:unnamed protein product, partial [Polarella glacialis]
FALLIYEDQGGEQDCWNLCFEELCALFAKDRMQQASLGALRREPLTVALGTAPVGLRASPASVLPQSSQLMLGSAAPLSGELSQEARLLRNLHQMRGAADGGDLEAVPRQAPVMVPVDALRYTHNAISDHFKDGRSIADLVGQLQGGKIDPLREPSLCLDVVEFHGRYWSLRNRRLHALKQYQQQLRASPWYLESGQVQVHVHVLPLTHPAVFHKFIECFDTETGGETVSVRNSRFRGHSS